MAFVIIASKNVSVEIKIDKPFLTKKQPYQKNFFWLFFSMKFKYKVYIDFKATILILIALASVAAVIFMSLPELFTNFKS